MNGRWDIYREIQTLDPARDHQRIMHLIGGWEFPWDVARALEAALYRTFCVPAISELLDRMGEFAHRAQRRYDDTGLLLTEVTQHGYDSERGREALRRINRIHARFPIANEDFLYVLSTFHFEPVRWINRFGWRRMSAIEVEASFLFWREIGRRMGLRDLPRSNREFEAFVEVYERTRYAYSDANRRLGEAARDLLLSWFPRPVWPVLRLGVHALTDPAVLAAMGFSRPSPVVRDAVAGLLHARGHVLRWLPPRRTPSFITAGPVPSYPTGYEISRLGPPGMDESSVEP
ncbi:MAG: DUF2236 domain-containing protein [Planctomycetes bacterium]|nr:DUF2236 domain-containing protein [Planctomycetota bacterium]